MKQFSKILENLSDRLNKDDDYIEVQDDLIVMIDNTINSDNNEEKIELINKFIEDKTTTIIGLVNDSDIFDFYIKNKNQIDKILSESDHFSKSPQDIGIVSSIYEYIIESTIISIQEIFTKMVSDGNLER